MQLEQDVVDAVHAVVGGYEECGSRVTCDPAPTDTDRDFLVEIPVPFEGLFGRALLNLGFKLESASYEGNEGFLSWRRGDLNLIVTTNEKFASRHRAATYICTRLNIMQKPDRIALFQAVLYGHKWRGRD